MVKMGIYLLKRPAASCGGAQKGVRLLFGIVDGHHHHRRRGGEEGEAVVEIIIIMELFFAGLRGESRAPTPPGR